MLFTTPPLEIVDAPADDRHIGGHRSNVPEFIVLHHTGPWPALEWLTTDKRSNVSAHRYIEPNKPIYKLVDDTVIANTQGYADVGPWSDAWGSNFNGVALSVEGAFDPQTEIAWRLDVVMKMAWQVCEWWGLYGFLPIVYHSQVDRRKNDPRLFPRAFFDAYLLRLVGAAQQNRLTDWREFLPGGKREG